MINDNDLVQNREGERKEEGRDGEGRADEKSTATRGWSGAHKSRLPFDMMNADGRPTCTSEAQIRVTIDSIRCLRC